MPYDQKFIVNLEIIQHNILTKFIFYYQQTKIFYRKIIELKKIIFWKKRKKKNEKKRDLNVSILHGH